MTQQTATPPQPHGSQQPPTPTDDSARIRRLISNEFGRKIGEELDITRCPKFRINGQEHNIEQIANRICEQQTGGLFFGPLRYGKTFSLAAICFITELKRYSYFPAKSLAEALLFVERAAGRQLLGDEWDRLYNLNHRLSASVVIIDDLNDTLNSLEVSMLADYVDARLRKGRGTMAATNMTTAQWTDQKAASVSWGRLLTRVEEMTFRCLPVAETSKL